jgi:hypothetical protein
MPPIDFNRALSDAQDAASRAFGYFTSDDTTASSIGVDEGDKPYDFGYGTHKSTIGHDITWTDESDHRNGQGPLWHQSDGLRARVFGSASAQTLSASLGAETQIGFDSSQTDNRPSLHKNYHEDIFLGLRARGYAEAGLLGLTAGAEAFLGYSDLKTRNTGNVGSKGDWISEKEELNIGVGTSAKVHLGITSSILLRAEAGIDYRYERKDHFKEEAECGWLVTDSIDIFAGARSQVKGSIGPMGASAEAEAFAGIEAAWRPQLGLAHNGTEFAAVFLNLKGRIGVGANADYHFGFDWETKRIDASADAGVAVGFGASVGGGVSIGGNDIEKAFDFPKK